MLQSIKVDLIYFATPTDFEMEFNLGGCCRMRLLADKAADRKGFIHLLSRAVSRSRVIICCGSLFGNGGLIAGVAAAIGRPLTKADNATYGIQVDQEISIIEGSMPLVTADGVFGGCVIESGPQAIILLTESKSVRKTLMSSLIHPYIEGLSRKDPNAPADAVKPEETASETAAASEETEAAVEEPAVETTEESAEVSEEVSAEPTEQPEEISSVVSEEPTTDEPAEEFTAETATVEEITEETSAQTDRPEQEEEWVINIGENEKKPDEETAASTEETTEEVTEEAEQNASADEEKSEEPASAFPIDPAEMQLFIDPQDVVFNHKKYYEMYYEAEESLVGGIGETAEPEKRRLPLPILILIIVLAVCLVFLGIWLIAIPLLRGVSVAQNFSNLFGGTVLTGRLP